MEMEQILSSDNFSRAYEANMRQIGNDNVPRM